MLSEAEQRTYEVITTIAGSIGVLGSTTLLWLIYDTKFDNLYSLCIFGMAVGLLIYNITDMYFIYNKVDHSNLWLVIINVWSSLVSYYLSSVISISMYFLLARQYAIPIQDPKILVPALTFLVIALGIFLAVTLSTQNEHSHINHSNLCSISIKLFFTIINLISYFLCEYLLRKNYNNKNIRYNSSMNNEVANNNGGSEVLTRKYAAIRALVRKMRFYPLLQILSIVPFYIWGFLHAGFSTFYVGGQDSDSTYLAISIFTFVCLLLDAFWMLVVYLILNPLAVAKLKRKLLCLTSNDQFDNRDPYTISDDDSFFSDYRQSNSNQLEVDSGYGCDSNKLSNNKLNTELLSDCDRMNDDAFLSKLSDKDLMFLVEGRESTAMSRNAKDNNRQSDLSTSSQSL